MCWQVLRVLCLAVSPGRGESARAAMETASVLLSSLAWCNLANPSSQDLTIRETWLIFCKEMSPLVAIASKVQRPYK